MHPSITRRTLMRLGLGGLGGVVFVPAVGSLLEPAHAADASEQAPVGQEAFFFVQLSDIHLGFTGPSVNPDAEGTLAKAIAAVNALEQVPEFVIFTGDLSHHVDDDAERRRRLGLVQAAIHHLRTKAVYVMPGEHDAALDRGAVYQSLFGPMHYSFTVKGVHAIVLDNVSDPVSRIGPEQLAWLKADLATLKGHERIIVFAHRPLFDLLPAWDWSTSDGAAVLECLMPFPDVTVFYGHIHQEHHHQTGHIQHHSACSLMYALPAPGSVPKKAPLPWDPAQPYRGLGFSDVPVDPRQALLSPAHHGILPG